MVRQQSPQRHVLVSGAGGGIGEAVVQSLADAGFGIYAGVLEESECARLAAIDPCIKPVVLDLTDLTSVSNTLRHINSDLSGRRLYGLWSNAGISRVCAFKNMSNDQIRSIIEVNLLGTMNLIHSAIPLLERGVSRVAITGSATGMFAGPGVSVYSATKWALEGFVDALRIELAQQGISVSLIQPGLIRSPMSEGVKASVDQLLSSMSKQDVEDFGVIVRKISTLSENATASPEAVVKSALHIFTGKKPRRRYRAGLDAKAVALIRHLPDFIKDFLQRKIYSV